jgi:TonB family protein
MENSITLRLTFLLASFGVIQILFFSQIAESVTGQNQKKTEKKDLSSGEANDHCLNSALPKPKVIARGFGVVNQNARELPQPTLPVEARAARLSGEVKVNIVIDVLTGTVMWARMETGSAELQDAVKDVVCRARFFPINDANVKINAFLVYRFNQGKAVPFKRTSRQRH